jgi:hypothetical protein
MQLQAFVGGLDLLLRAPVSRHRGGDGINGETAPAAVCRARGDMIATARCFG